MRTAVAGAARLSLCLLALGAAGLAAANALERDRLINLEGPDTVGWLRVRFDFQHNFKDYTLHPIADLTLALGVWKNVNLEGEVLLHNLESRVFGNESLFQFNVMELGLKWAPLDQSQGDWCSLAVGGSLGRSDVKMRFIPADPAAPTNLIKSHLFAQSLYAVAHYDLPWYTQYLAVRYAEFRNPLAGPIRAVTTPGIGARLKLLERRDARIHLIGDFQPRTFESRFSANAWGAGVQFMYQSPHIYTLFVSNTHGDTSAESVFGTRSDDPRHYRAQERFYGFRWSYRF
jgi:hypothetical protein